MGEELRHTPLEAEHRRLGARMGPFSGWLMPIEYSGTLAEHRAVRESVGVFDVSHLGRIMVEGSGALDCLQRTLSNDLTKVPPGGAQYGLALNDRGGIVDDLIVYRLGAERFLVVPNAANLSRVDAGIRRRLPEGTTARLRDDLALIAPQGPGSPEIVERLLPDAGELGYMTCREDVWRHQAVVVSRSGYTGERGFELFVPVEAAADLWRELVEAGAVPAGLAARDTLRLEMGYPLHGNDISPERTPLEAGLSWAVAFDKGQFEGRKALTRLRERGVAARLRGLLMLDRPIPRPGYGVFRGDRTVGETTSGTFSPTLRVGIALAYLDTEVTVGDVVEVDVRGRRGRARVVKPPFVDASPR